MSSLGKSIDLYLMDGTAVGKWQATLSNWNCVSFKIPRGELKDCGELSALHAPGVYFLFGWDDETRRQFVYVGEGDDVLKRLLQPHSFEKDGSYWTETVVFVTPDGTLEKGRIKYLENRFYAIVRETRRYMVKNGNTPPQSPVPKKIQDLLEEFIINAKLVMPALGHKVFEPQPSSGMTNTSGEDDEMLYFSRNHGKGGKATGKITDDGFWILKGSYIYPKTASYLPRGIKKARLEYSDRIDAFGVLQEDIRFGSPSYASSFVCGKNSNGLVEWRNKEGKSLKVLNGESEDDGELQKTELAAKRKTDAQNIFGTKADLHLTCKGVTAHGYTVDDGFVVVKGSQIIERERESCPERIKKHRQQLIQTDKINADTFKEDVLFSSPSAAAAFIVGGEANGLIMWVDKEGKKLKELQKREQKLS